MFHNKMPKYEILSQEALHKLDQGWRRLVSEIGVEFMSDRALDLFKKAGQTVEGNNVKFDPDFVMEQVKKAPSEFDVQARNPKILYISVATTWCLVGFTALHLFAMVKFAEMQL